jgi:ribonucleoside-diphosphate reductase alpha chain
VKAAPEAEPAAKHGLTIKRHFTRPGTHPFDEVEWETRTASLQNEKGQTIFEQRNVEAPKDWSQTATNIVASKYFHGKLDSPERESSVKQLISRVADTIAQWGIEGGYFRSEEDARNFHDELLHLLVRQKAAFNSPFGSIAVCGTSITAPRRAGAGIGTPPRAVPRRRPRPTVTRSAQPALSTPSRTTSKAS